MTWDEAMLFLERKIPVVREAWRPLNTNHKDKEYRLMWLWLGTSGTLRRIEPDRPCRGARNRPVEYSLTQEDRDASDWIAMASAEDTRDRTRSMPIDRWVK